MRTTAPGIFVGTTWIAMFSAAIYYVLRYASADPFGDEWDLMTGVTFQEPYLNWLWTQHNEHRLPLPKLIYTWLLNLSNFDVRAGGLATVAVLGAVSLAFVVAARKIRGQVEFADAFFPVAFLNWGHFENYLIGFQISFAMSMALACVWLLTAFNWIDRRQPASLKWMGIALLLLPLCGAHGLVYVPPLCVASLWLARSAPRFAQCYMLLVAIVAFATTAANFVNYQSPAAHPHSEGVLASLHVSLEVLSLGWGWVGQMTWPASGQLLGLFYFSSAVLIIIALIRRPSERERLITVVALVAGTTALAMGIGWGRSGFGPLAGFAVRYGILMLPLMAVGYLAWLRYGGPLFGSLVPMGMFVIACLFLTQHCRTGLAEGRDNAAAMSAFATDLKAGMPADKLAQNHPKLYPDAELFAGRIRVLQSAGIPRYAPTTFKASR